MNQPVSSPPEPTPDLDAHIASVSHAACLLVACDFDGTLAPIAPSPSQAKPRASAVAALHALSRIDRTKVAIISGRGLADLGALIGQPGSLRLIGSHGAEFEPSFESGLCAKTLALKQDLLTRVSVIAQQTPGSIVEIKAAGVAFHYRESPQQGAQAAIGKIIAGPGSLRGVYTRLGKMVIELSLVRAHKGEAVEALRREYSPTSILFIGDDETDEDAFAALGPPDLGIKVGHGTTAAQHRLPDDESVAALLTRLAEQRLQWFAGRRLVPIEQHSLLSDQRSVGLVTGAGRITWLCVPRIDSPALFSEILGGPAAGFFDVCPVAPPGPARQAYEADTMILRTHWPSMTVTDYLDCSGGRSYQRAGRSDLVRVLEGPGRVRVEFAPRLNFGRTATRLQLRDGGIDVLGSTDPIVLAAPNIPWLLRDEGQHQSAFAEFDLGPAPVVLELRYGTRNLDPPEPVEAARREQTRRSWQSWCDSLALPSLRPDLVKRSALAIRALCYGPTGAISAAATTSLPEQLGGIRNWDYRYCWPRDACLAAAALVRIGNTGHALKLLDWLIGVIDECESPDRLRPIYTVTGRVLGPEAEISELAGYASSKPVRIGNSASSQVQLDVFGHIVDLIATLVRRGAPIPPDHWRIVEAMVAAVAARWNEPDQGIWEVRGPPRHHVHSKIMCWMTVDRALSVAEHYLGCAPDGWRALCGQIREDVLAHGYKSAVNAFTARYEDLEPDAAALWVGLGGLLPPGDPRFIGTVEFVERTLAQGPTVYRYKHDDSLPGREGGFNICTTWLIESLALIGRTDDARRLFDAYTALAGPTGLYSEEFDPVSGLALGNYPQAYSHLGLINAAVRLSFLPKG